MKFKIEIDCDNAVFHDPERCVCDSASSINCAETTAEEVARLLRDTAEKLENGYRSGHPFDANGNKVGEWGFSK